MPSPEFIALQKEWYRKLEASGFRDIERFDNQGQPLELFRDRSGSVRDPFEEEFQANLDSYNIRAQGLEDYYRMAGWWSWDRVWPSRRDRYVWQAHADGEPMRSISQSQGSVHMALGPVCELINEEAERMKAYYGVDPQ